MKLQIKELRKIMNEVVESSYDDSLLKIKLIVNVDAEDLVDHLKSKADRGVPFAAERRARELIKRKLETIVQDLTDLALSEISDINGIPIAIRSIKVSKNS